MGLSVNLTQLRKVDRSIEIIQTKTQRKKEWKKYRKGHQELVNINCSNIHVIGIPEEERKNKAEEPFEEIMVENYLYVMIDIKPQTPNLRKHQAE